MDGRQSCLSLHLLAALEASLSFSQPLLELSEELLALQAPQRECLVQLAEAEVALALFIGRIDLLSVNRRIGLQILPLPVPVPRPSPVLTHAVRDPEEAELPPQLSEVERGPAAVHGVFFEEGLQEGILVLGEHLPLR